MENIYLIIGMVAGIGVGFVIGWLVVERRSRLQISMLQTDLAVSREREQDAIRQAREDHEKLETLRQDLSLLQQERASLHANLQNQQDQFVQLRDQYVQNQQHLESLRKELVRLDNDRATLVANLESEKKMLQEQRAQLNEMSHRLKETFAELSVEALQKNTDQFINLAEQKFKNLQTQATSSLEQKKAEMAQLIQPLQQTLEQYKNKLDEIEKARGNAYVDIKQHLTEVATTQKNLSVETRQLVQALRRPEGRGRWGELTLRRLFELAGMAEHVTFLEQVTNQDGRYRPDCIVQLPNQRQIIIDSKCVIDAYLDSHACNDNNQRLNDLKRHARHVRDHVKKLSERSYWEQFENVPDFVVMFLPGEVFLYAAVEQEPNLIEDALKQRIIIAAPTSLLGLLRVIEYGWQQQKIEQNAREIRDLASELYKRIITMSEHVANLGKAIETAADRYNKMVGSMEQSVLPAARRMREKGIGNAQQPIPEIGEIDGHPRELSPDKWKKLPEPPVNPDGNV